MYFTVIIRCFLQKMLSSSIGALLEQRHSGYAAQERRPAFQTGHNGNRSPFRRAVAIVSFCNHPYIYLQLYAHTHTEQYTGGRKLNEQL